jgi:hypothetical protein
VTGVELGRSPWQSVLTGDPDDRREKAIGRIVAEGRRLRFLGAVAKSVLQILTGGRLRRPDRADRHERSAERLNWSNGYRERPSTLVLARKKPKLSRNRDDHVFQK